MSKMQCWSVQTPDGMHEVTYRYSFWTGKSVFSIDGTEYVQKLKPFRIGIERREVFRLDEEQCILAVSKKGKAEILGGAWKETDDENFAEKQGTDREIVKQ